MHLGEEKKSKHENKLDSDKGSKANLNIKETETKQ